MQMGFNNDIEHLGRTLHIQTEDHGMSARKVTSQLFFDGAILESKTLPYGAAIEEAAGLEEQQELIRKQMRTMHKAFYRRVQEGHYDERLNATVPRSSAPVAVAVESLFADLVSEAEANLPEGFEAATPTDASGPDDKGDGSDA